MRPNDCAGIGSGCTGTYMTRDVNGTPIGVQIEWYIEAGSLEMTIMAPTALARVADLASFKSDFPNAVMTDGTTLRGLQPVEQLFYTRPSSATHSRVSTMARPSTACRAART